MLFNPLALVAQKIDRVDERAINRPFFWTSVVKITPSRCQITSSAVSRETKLFDSRARRPAKMLGTRILTAGMNDKILK